MYKFEIHHHELVFRQPATTSRGVYNTRHLWLVRVVSDDLPGRGGVGECAPLPDLSCDYSPDYESRLRQACDKIENNGASALSDLRDMPSMLFGVETALLNLHKGSSALYDTLFSRGREGIPINGLVWMGDYDTMLSRLQDKIDAGFRCVKLKIGAIDFDKELDLMRHVRDAFSVDALELRLDANGAFSPEDALRRLDLMAKFDVHSIEQPICQGQWTEMSRLCKVSPIDIALDEELIGINSFEEKKRLLETIAPQYIILKPSLHGGVSGTREWIALAGALGIGSWITSALESNIGLNAVAQLAADIYGPDITLPQGLGTGQLFVENFDMPIHIDGCRLFYDNDES